jgi:hypothetical protein
MNDRVTTAPRLDPITLALVQKRVDHIAERMGQVMLKTARSPIFNQSHDFSCFLTDGRARLVSQADGIPIHTGGGGLIVEAVLQAFDDIAPGDVFIGDLCGGRQPLSRLGCCRRCSSMVRFSHSSAIAPTSRTSAVASRAYNPAATGSSTRVSACRRCA